MLRTVSFAFHLDEMPIAESAEFGGGHLKKAFLRETQLSSVGLLLLQLHEVLKSC